jgi:hypothetical protein
VNIRRATEALRSCSSLPEFCQILEDCLKPAGVDGFGITSSSELPDEPEVYPFTHLGASKLHFFWDRSMKSSETNWSLSFSLRKRNGERLGAFTLYRQDASSPLWLDVEVFTAAGFCNAVARVIEKVQDSWFGGSRVKVPEISTVKTTTVITSVKQPLAVSTAT